MHRRRYSFKKAPEHETPTRQARGSEKKPKIRCPECKWQPDGKKYWGCEKCSAVFDTFVTRAHCPRCPNSWTFTQCIRCGVKSDHEAWYAEEDDAK
jgi:rubrerythrin